MGRSLNSLEQSLCEAVDAQFDEEHLPWFRRLVNQPSHTGAREDVEAAASIVDAQLQSIGMRRTLVEDPDGVFADHRIFSSPAIDDGDRGFALVGHVDTVFPRSIGFLEFQRDPLDSESGGDVVRGPGVLDMKSGLSVIVFALTTVQRVAPEVFARLKLRFFMNTDEEVGSPTSNAMFKELAPRISQALVFECGRDEDRIITSRRGSATFTMHVTGRASHAGNDHATGLNAIHVLALLIPRIEALTDYASGATVNVGLIEGGSAKNTVPENASCVIDARFGTMEDADQVVAALKAIAERPFDGIDNVKDHLLQATARLEGRVSHPPMEPSAGNQGLRKVYEDYAGAVGLKVGEAPLQGGASDANLLAGFSVPTVDGLGPFGKNFHSPKEWSSLSSLRKRTKALACFLVEGIDRLQ